MTNFADLDRRRPRTENHVFEAHDQNDETKAYHFEAFRDEEDAGVYLNFVDPADRRGEHRVRDHMWIDAQQCREFGEALIKAADLADAAER